jgi:hypothetical protein
MSPPGSCYNLQTISQAGYLASHASLEAQATGFNFLENE